MIFNLENGGFGATGQNRGLGRSNLATQRGTAYFYTDADLNSGNAILTVPLSALGLTPGTHVQLLGVRLRQLLHRQPDRCDREHDLHRSTRRASPPSVDPGASFRRAARSRSTLRAVPGGDVKSPSQTGLLLMYRNAEGKSRKDVGKDEAQAVEVKTLID